MFFFQKKKKENELTPCTAAKAKLKTPISLCKNKALSKLTPKNVYQIEFLEARLNVIMK